MHPAPVQAQRDGKVNEADREQDDHPILLYSVHAWRGIQSGSRFFSRGLRGSRPFVAGVEQNPALPGPGGRSRGDDESGLVDSTRAFPRGGVGPGIRQSAGARLH